MNITTRGELGYRLTKSNSLVYTGNGVYLSDDGRRFEPVGRTVFKDEAYVTDENVRILFETR